MIMYSWWAMPSHGILFLEQLIFFRKMALEVSSSYLSFWVQQQSTQSLKKLTSYLFARTNNVLVHRDNEERRISPRRWKTSYMYGDIWRYFFRAVKYAVLYPRAKIRCSSYTRWDTTFVLLPIYEIRLWSADPITCSNKSSTTIGTVYTIHDIRIYV